VPIDLDRYGYLNPDRAPIDIIDRYSELPNCKDLGAVGLCADRACCFSYSRPSVKK